MGNLFLPDQLSGYMGGFKGQATYSVDATGRVAIPARMRASLSSEAQNTFTVTRGFEACIFAYPLDTWQKTVEKEIGALNRYSREARAFTRRIMMWAEELALDRQGRLALPKPLLEYAAIKGRVQILGAYDHIEIWDPDSLEAYLKAETADYETLAAHVMRE